MKQQYYFKDTDSSISYTEDYFIDEMKFDGVKEMKVIEAIPDKDLGVFWCHIDCECYEKGNDYCGKECRNYQPRNGKSGRCKYHSTKLYRYGEEVTLKLNEE